MKRELDMHKHDNDLFCGGGANVEKTPDCPVNMNEHGAAEIADADGGERLSEKYESFKKYIANQRAIRSSYLKKVLRDEYQNTRKPTGANNVEADA